MKKREQQEIPEPTLRRLPWYLAHVQILQQEGVRSVSSTGIAKGIGVAPALVAKDLSYLDLMGKTRVGYVVDNIVTILEEFLGFTQQHNAYVFGVGNLGAALIADKGLAQYGLNIRGGFDVAPDLVGQTLSGTPVYHMDELEEIISKDPEAIGILTVPINKAQEVSDTIIAHGVKAIWNFTPFRIRVPKNIVVQNTSMYSHLAVMFNRLRNNSEAEKQASKG